VFSQVKLNISPSKVVSLLLALPFLATAPLLYSLELATPLLYTILTSALLSGCYCVARYGVLYTSTAVSHLAIHGDTIKLRDKANKESSVTFFKGSVLCNKFLLLSFEQRKYRTTKFLPRPKYHLILTPFNTDNHDALRRLSVLIQYRYFSTVDE